MILASEVLNAIRREYPVHALKEPDECGYCRVKIGPVGVLIYPPDWVLSLALDAKESSSMDPAVELLRKFPNDYEMGKAIVSFDNARNYETSSRIAAAKGMMSMTLQQKCKADYHSIFKFIEHFEEPDDMMKIIDSIDELAEIAEIDRAGAVI